jgi:hypothetical protein
MTEVNRSLVTCAWCDTVNGSLSYQCVVCDIPLGLPVISSGTRRGLESILQAAVTTGGARRVASAFIEKKIEWTNSRLARKCLQLALAEEFASFDYEFHVADDRTLSVGWRWPEAKFVNQVSILSVRESQIIGRHVENRGSKTADVAINLRTSRDVHVDGTEYFMSLRCYIDANMVPMAARRVWTENRETVIVDDRDKVGR